jgi:hypothetical protein
MASLTDRMIGAMKGDAKTFQEIEADPNALGQAITVIVIAGVASMIGNIFRGGFFGGAIALIVSIIGYAVYSVLIVLIGTKLMPEPQTKADFQEAFRVIGFTASPGVFNVLTVLPIVRYLISFAIAIWMLVIGVIAVREVLDYSDTGRAIIVCVIAFVVYCIVLFFILTPIFLARLALG